MTVEMLPWIVARATGFVAFALLGSAMIAGLLIRTRGSIGSVRAGGMVDLHRHLSLLALLAVAAHGAALALDTTIDIDPLDLVVPGLLPYRPIWTGLGVVAAELALLVHLSFRVRTRIGGRAWRRIHWVTYGVFVLGAMHGIASGTDSGTMWAMMLYGGVVGAVAGLTGWRAASFRRTRTGRGARHGRAGQSGFVKESQEPRTGRANA